MSILIKGIDLPKDARAIDIMIEDSKGNWLKSAYIRETDRFIQIPTPHGRLKDFDGDGIHPIIVDGEYMVKVDDLDEMPTILEAEE